MEKTNLDGAPELAPSDAEQVPLHPKQTFASATNSGEKRKREGLVSRERESGNSSEMEEVIIVGDTKAIKDFGFGGGEESQRSVFSKRQAFDVQSNINLKGSLAKEEAGEEPERAKQDSTFNDFDKLREEVIFAVGQTWALYDDKVDGMPRLYAQITKVSVPGFCLGVTWLEPDPDEKEEIQRYEKDLPVSVGWFKLGKTEDIKDRGRFSHVVHCNEGIRAGLFSVYPREGETWAVFKGRHKNYDIDWSSDPDSLHEYKNSGDVVPLDIVTEVLNRLPAGSVARFMVVSKSWARIIRSKCFIRSFPFGSLTQPLRLLMAFNHQDRAAGHQSCRFLYSSSLSSSSSTSSIPTSFLSTITWPHQRYSRVEYPIYCVKGLVCVGEVICNPCSGKSITLPSFKAGISTRFERFFGYDPVSDEYKVLLMRKTFMGRKADPWSYFGVFTLGAKQESWREIHCSVPHRPYSRGVCIDGALYYIAHTGTAQKSVVRFDLKSEKFDIFARVSEDIRDWHGRVPTTLIKYIVTSWVCLPGCWHYSL